MTLPPSHSREPGPAPSPKVLPDPHDATTEWQFDPKWGLMSRKIGRQHWTNDNNQYIGSAERIRLWARLLSGEPETGERGPDVLAVLRVAQHALDTTDGLTATDRIDIYDETLRDGCDAKSAWDVFRSVCWKIDNSAVRAQVDAAIARLAPLPNDALPACRRCGRTDWRPLELVPAVVECSGPNGCGNREVIAELRFPTPLPVGEAAPDCTFCGDTGFKDGGVMGDRYPCHCKAPPTPPSEAGKWLTMEKEVADADQANVAAALRGPGLTDGTRTVRPGTALSRWIAEAAAQRDRADRLASEIDALAGALDRAEVWDIELAAIREIVRVTCDPANNEGYEEEDAGLATPMYRAQGEDGETIIEADNLPDAVRGIVRCWENVYEWGLKEQSEAATLTSRVAALTEIAREVLNVASRNTKWITVSIARASYDDALDSLRTRLASLAAGDSPVVSEGEKE